MHCVDDNTGNITNTVCHDGLSTAQQLIDLVTANIQMKNPVYLIHGWSLHLSTNLTTAGPSLIASSSPTALQNDDDISSLTLAIMIIVGCISFCVILALITCIIVGLVYIKQKRWIIIYTLYHNHYCTLHYWCRQTSKADATDIVGDKIEAANNKTKDETLSSHVYDDINQVPVKLQMIN